ncbi:uncharacterized protein TNCV_3819321 [Trichonephila clavipes]|nr:uncharacterized protein TNCV_3819321 [Trichonephila clavipes]
MVSTDSCTSSNTPLKHRSVDVKMGPEVTEVLGSNPGEDMDVCKCIVPLRHGCTLNSRRAASPLVWLVEVEERWETPGHPQGFLPLNWGGTEPNRTVTCMELKATANDRCKNSSL